MFKLRLPQIIALIGGALAVMATASFNIWRMAHEINVTLTPPSATILAMPPNTTPSLGLSASDSTGTQMVYVPSGCFSMGKDAPADNPFNGGQPFTMCFSEGYWLDRTVVTNAAYQQFIDEGGYEQQGTWWSDPGWAWLQSMNNVRPYNYDGFIDPLQPRVGVMWYEASAYCHWRGGRLQTEPEWEYAARGPNSLIYPWGNSFDPSYVVYAASSDDKPAPVGSKPGGASWVGALDMSGNVGQWTSTAYEEYDPLRGIIESYRYPYPTMNDGRESENVDYRWMIVRGSTWNEPNVDHLRAAFRGVSIPDQERYRQISIGFRCTRSS